MKKTFSLVIILGIALYLINSISAQRLSLSNHVVVVRNDTSKVLLTRAEFLNTTSFNNPLKNYSYYNCLGVMCQLEYKMQKAIKVPLCFRLGSVEYTNKVDAEPISPNP